MTAAAQRHRSATKSPPFDVPCLPALRKKSPEIGELLPTPNYAKLSHAGEVGA